VKLCQSFDDEATFFSCSFEDIAVLIGRVPEKPFTMSEVKKQAEEDALFVERRGISYVSCVDLPYPPLLLEIFDPPAVLFYRGILPNPETPLIAMVGTRHPSNAAQMNAYNIAREFGKLRFSVVSGLALGIDAMSHRGNIEAGAATVAVLGSSLDEVYPSSNRPLAQRIVAGGGVLLSEYPPGTRPAKWQFPARNRIISGISRGTLIVEAPEKSGALITARFAMEQNRDIWVSSVSIGTPQGQGCTALAKEGARVILSADDILKEWGFALQKNDRLFNERDLFSPAELAADLAKALGL
jgi:DNA processing protein